MSWFQKNYPTNWYIEVKATEGRTIPKSAVKPHQLKALLAVASDQGFKHKMSDAGHQRQPFDAFGCKKGHAYVVACFLSHKIALSINPEDWEGANILTYPTFSIPL